MNHDTVCRRRILASDGICRVELCSCGRMHLHIGPVSMCLDPDVLPRIARVVGDAHGTLRADRDDAPPTPGPVFGERAGGKGSIN